MRTERIPVADGVELAVDAWSAGRQPDRRPPRADAAASSSSTAWPRTRGLWDGVAAALVAAGHAAVTVDLRGHGRSSKPDGPYDVPTVADDLATLIERARARAARRRRAVLGRQRRPRARGPPPRTRPRASSASTAAGWSRAATFADWDACRAALAPPRLAGRRFDEIEGYIRSAHPTGRRAGIRGVARQLRGPAGRHGRPVADVRPPHRGPARALGAPPVRALRRASRSRSCSRPADGGDDATGPRRKRGDVEAAAAAIPNARVRWFAGDHDIHAQHPDELAGVMHDIDGRRVLRDERARGSSRSWARARPRRRWPRSTAPCSSGSAPAPVPAAILDTPYGFQENADELSARTVEFFARERRARGGGRLVPVARRRRR